MQIILTGIPIRVRKKYAVVKHMFYEPTVSAVTVACCLLV